MTVVIQEQVYNNILMFEIEAAFLKQFIPTLNIELLLSMIPTLAHCHSTRADRFWC